MSKRRLLSIALIIIVPVLVIALWLSIIYISDLPDRISQHETIILGQNHFTPGSQTALRVVVRDSKDGAPLPESQIRVFLQPQNGGQKIPIYQGVTDPQGSANVAFKVPDDLETDQTLIVETQSSLGSDYVERPVTVERDYRLLLSSDKPIYQPGQVIHLRVLGLSAFDLMPAADQNLEIVIADGKGNKVFRKNLTTSEYGVAAVDFQLASEVNTGAYKITANLGNTSSEKTVNVENYVLPKYKITLKSDKTFYLPGEHVQGTLQAGYFFGKPVDDAEVHIVGYTFDVQQNQVLDLQGKTNAEGRFDFEFDLPAYLAGSDLEGGLGRFYLQATLTDQAKHSESSDLSLPVAASALVIEAIPEGGQFRQGVENILYVLTSYPDGAPAETGLTLTFYQNGQTLTAQSGPYGLAEIRLTPDNPYQELSIQARDAQGNISQREFYFQGEYQEETVLLRPEKPVYRVGDTMSLTLLTSQPKGTVYLDMVREGQTVSTRSVEVSNGHAEVAVDLTPDLYGTLELHAYKILRSGTITRDTRLVVVDQAGDLNVSLTPQFPGGASDYRPGQDAGLDVQVAGQDGKGAQAALGLAIVDEAVFALAEQDPGFARLYFLLEKELLQPKYDLHGFSVPDLVKGVPVSAQPTLDAIERAAQASLADAAAGQFAAGAGSFSLQANSHQDAMRRAAELQGKYFQALSKGLFAAVLIPPLAVTFLSAYPLWKQKRLGRSLVSVLVVLLSLALLFLLWPLGEENSWATTPLERMEVFTNWLGRGNPEIFLLCTALLGLAGFIILGVVAWRRKDSLLGWSLGLLPVFIIVLACLVYVATNASSGPQESAAWLALAAIFLLPLALFLRGADYAWERQALPALAALALAILLLMAPFLAALASYQVGGNAMRKAAGGPVLVEEVALQAVPSPMAMPAMAGAAFDAEAEKKAEGGAAANATAAEPPRLRQYFPETMLWLPGEVTDASGALHLEFPVADSITTWRVTALASTQDGRLGSAVTPLRVFQDFFIDLDLPLALTVGDEVAIPVGVFNYMAEEQQVRLEVEQADWFELLDEPSKEMTIAANDISVIYFRIRARGFGRQPFKVTAWGSKMSDAIQKEVRVFPDGKQITYTQSDRLSAETPVRQSVNIPAEVIPGTQTLMVKVYPGVLSQVVEGLDSILRMPYGCFEQTSSTTYPNVLVMDYLKTTNQASPETQMKAEEYINLGYQRLTTFEVQSSGGFSLFGNPPADRMLTAYGLQEFADMSRVHDVDPAFIQRAADWLLSQQAGDGSWENDRGLVHEDTWSKLENDRLPVTAYIAWSLVEAGFGDQPGTRNGIAYVRERQAQAKDAYVLALVANALVAADLDENGKISDATQAVLDRLAGMAVVEGSSAYWPSGVATFMGSEGQTGSIETTALAALAFLRSGSHPDLGNSALTYLVCQKDSFGTWHSTQATVLTLKALIQSIRGGSEKVDATVTITLNGGQQRTLQVNKDNFDVVQLVSFDDVNPGKENAVEISTTGEGNLMYQVSGSYYLPWDRLALYPELAQPEEAMSIQVSYDRSELNVDDTVTVNVTAKLTQPGSRAESALVDLGLPPGFSVQAEDLQALVTRFQDTPADYPDPKIERFELTGRQILIYVTNLSAGNPLQFSYRLKARFPLVAKTPSSNAYDYYNPQVTGEVAPQVLVVK